jgi:hypothetical protein
MLKIRKEQMDVLEKYMIDVFNSRMVSHLRNTYPEETSAIPDEELTALVKSGSEKAESYGIVEDDDIQGFLGCMLIHGSDFDTDSAHPQVQEILGDTRLDGEEKIDLVEFCFESSWED